jgi:hypothetical protein
MVGDAVYYSDGLQLTQLIVHEAIISLPRFWMKSSAIDDEILDFTQKGGWHRIDSEVPATFKMSYACLLEHFDTLSEGLKVCVNGFFVFIPLATDIATLG